MFPHRDNSSWALITLFPDLALVSIKIAPSCYWQHINITMWSHTVHKQTSANFSPSRVLTSRSPWDTSLLFPISNRTLDSSLRVAWNYRVIDTVILWSHTNHTLITSLHPFIPTNELRLVMSYTKMKASARRQYTAVIGPNRSCPAVSHNWSNTGSLSTTIVRVM